MFASRGARVHYLSATRGEGGEVGEPPLCTQAELGGVRQRELECAVEALGGASLTFLDYVDPLVEEGGQGKSFTAELAELASQLAARLRDREAQALITHGSNGEYGHPAHQLMSSAARAALELVGSTRTALYTVSAAYPDHPRPFLSNPDDPATFVIDVEPWLLEKLTAAGCHRTQAALFVRRSSQEAGRPVSLEEVLMRRESLHRAWPPFAGEPDDVLARFLRERCGEALVGGA